MHRQFNLNLLLLLQDWFAFLGNGSELNFTITGEEIFPNNGNPSAENNYGFCQVSDSCQLLSLKKHKT